MENRLYNLTSTAIKCGVPIDWLKDKAIAQEIPCLIINNRFLFNIESVNEKLLQLAANGGDNGD